MVDVTEMGNVTYLNVPKSLRKDVLPRNSTLAISGKRMRTCDEEPYNVMKGINVRPV
jgi:hypothetical protein